jgi:hypothetical protein
MQYNSTFLSVKQILPNQGSQTLRRCANLFQSRMLMHDRESLNIRLDKATGLLVLHVQSWQKNGSDGVKDR